MQTISEYLDQVIELLKLSPPKIAEAENRLALAITGFNTEQPAFIINRLLALARELHEESKAGETDVSKIIFELQMINDETKHSSRGAEIMLLPTLGEPPNEDNKPNLFEQTTIPSPPPRPPDQPPTPLSPTPGKFVKPTNRRSAWLLIPASLALITIAVLLCFVLVNQTADDEDTDTIRSRSSITVEHNRKIAPESATNMELPCKDSADPFLDSADPLRIQVPGPPVMDVEVIEGEDVGEILRLATINDEPDSESPKIMEVRVLEGENVGEIRHLMPLKNE